MSLEMSLKKLSINKLNAKVMCKIAYVINTPHGIYTSFSDEFKDQQSEVEAKIRNNLEQFWLGDFALETVMLNADNFRDVVKPNQLKRAYDDYSIISLMVYVCTPENARLYYPVLTNYAFMCCIPYARQLFDETRDRVITIEKTLMSMVARFMDDFPVETEIPIMNTDAIIDHLDVTIDRGIEREQKLAKKRNRYEKGKVCHLPKLKRSSRTINRRRMVDV